MLAFFAGAAIPPARGQLLINGGFEAPVQSPGSFQYDPPASGVTWTFAGYTGISSATGPWAPTGGATSQMAFLQIYGTGPHSFSQSVTIGGGNFTLSYQVGTRNGYPGIDYQVSLTNNSDQTVAFTSTERTTSGQAFTTLNYHISVPQAGSYTLAFLGLPNGDYSTD